MFCKKCGAWVDESASKCPECGDPIVTWNPSVPEDRSSILLAVLSFFFPLIGLILAFIFRKNWPKRSTSCGKGALIGIGVYVVVLFLSWMLLNCLLQVEKAQHILLIARLLIR
ncbi:MAG: zinc ribbon domain-containing protein [Clostridia bacterium]|jgi:uncharacterized membrane protein YvbJ|nr:zinc ribbon domain-containing protein [Clostridia bacterium]